MSVDLIQYAFVAGEISPQLFGRSDLTKYDLALSKAQNWFVNYEGGLSTRPGTEFCDFVHYEDQPTKFFSFRFSPDPADVYVLIFGHNYVRFLQDGAYVLLPSAAITDVSALGVVTSVAHGLLDGQWIRIAGVGGMTQLNNRTFIVDNKTTDTFTLVDPLTLAAVDMTGFDAYTSGGTFAKIYEAATPYSSSDLENLSLYQIRDYVRMTHPDYPIYNLNRVAADNWNVAEEVIGTTSFGPNNVNLTASAAGAMNVVYAVSAILEDGTETAIGLPCRIAGAVNFSLTAGSVKVTWDALAGAVSYIVYRSTISATGPGVSAGVQLGYLGSTRGTFFVDSNIIPDFTRAPLRKNNPFVLNGISSLTVTAGGAGYSFLADINATGFGGSGSGFRAYGIVNDAGVVVDTVIIDRGSGYVAPITVTVTGGGAGCTITATVDDRTGVYPSVSTLFQQRQIYAATLSQPLTLFGSQPKQFSNFDDSSAVTDASSYEFDIESDQVAPIRHMMSVRGGLLLMSQVGVWLFSGSNGGPATPTNALADPQTYAGVSKVEPIRVGSDLLYLDGRGYSVRLLSFNDFSKVYNGEDKSIMSSHLFGPGKLVTKWSFLEYPHKLVCAVREDGVMLAFTIVKEQEVFAWTQYSTNGFFKDIISSPEGDQDRAYITVRRNFNGIWRTVLERFSFRNFTDVEDAWCVDSGLKLEPPSVAATLTVSAETVTGSVAYVTLTAGSSVFTGKEEYAVRAAGGIFIIDSVTSGTIAVARVVKSATSLVPETSDVAPIVSGDWTMGEQVTEISGLWHLEGMTVKVLGDGNVFPDQVVTNGTITLPDAVSKAIIGLSYSCIARTLPPVVPQNVVESRRKRIVGIGVRMHEGRGLKNGPDLDTLYPMRERKNEPYGVRVSPTTGMRYQVVSSEWNEDVMTYFVQHDPLPVTILGLVPAIEVGDDPD